MIELKSEPEFSENKKSDLNKEKMELEEDLPKMFQCERCEKVFARKKYLNRHIKAIHDQIKNFECKECGKRFDITRNLVNHIRNVHKDKNVNNGKININDTNKNDKLDKNNKFDKNCEFDNTNMFDDLQNLDNHNVTADKSSPKSTIKSEKSIGNVFKCGICESLFGDIDDLTQHVEQNHTEINLEENHAEMFTEENRTENLKFSLEEKDETSIEESHIENYEFSIKENGTEISFEEIEEISLNKNQEKSVKENLEFDFQENEEIKIEETRDMNLKFAGNELRQFLNNLENNQGEIKKEFSNNDATKDEKSDINDEYIDDQDAIEKESNDNDDTKDNKSDCNDESAGFLKIVHSEVTNQECPVCHKRFNTNGNARRHRDTVHAKLFNMKTLTCDICGRSISDKTALQRHIQVAHDNVRDYECSLCKMKFPRPLSLTKHMDRIHHNIKKVEEGKQCPHCGKSYSSGGLKRHIQEIHFGIKSKSKYLEEQIACELCGRLFWQKEFLRRHFNQVHLNIRDFECQVCYKKFQNSSNFKRHVDSVHKKLKTFKCRSCPEEYTDKGEMTRHFHNVHIKLAELKQSPAKNEETDEGLEQSI